MDTFNGLVESDDEYVVLEGDLPLRPRPIEDGANRESEVTLTLDTIDAQHMLLSITPPRQPEGQLRKAACDIVLVIDVSGSMNSPAELPDQAGVAQKEKSGLSILDLVKHSCRTILEKLSEDDRLGIVTFSTQAELIQGLTPMTDIAKAETWKRIEHLKPKDITNLWAGIRSGLDLLATKEKAPGVQGVLVLTDGVPNHMCPSQGYVHKLQPMLRHIRDKQGGAPIISCFGFGYSLRSGLLRSISEVGRGNYAFIPDAGMIGTVFVHAVANLFSTYATRAEVTLECPNASAEIITPSYLEIEQELQASNRRQFHLGNIQYGQSRDIIIRVDRGSPKDHLKATLQYNIPNQLPQMISITNNFNRHSKLPRATIDYHVSRHELCTYLASLSTRNQQNEHRPLPAAQINDYRPILDGLAEKIRARINNALKSYPGSDTANLQSLLADIVSSDFPHSGGQIALALRTDPVTPSSIGEGQLAHGYRRRIENYYEKWGVHYLPSILHAHMRQLCTTFKDPGPLRYGVDSPLFLKVREELDDAFDRLPAPTPSLTSSLCDGRREPVRMGRFHYRGNPCFGGKCYVRMGDGGYVKVGDLRNGDVIWTLRGDRMVSELIKTDVKNNGGQPIVNIGGEDGLWITPYHPILHEGRWRFPATIGRVEAQVQAVPRVMNTGYIYSILLERDGDCDAHTIEVGGFVCATLGHGIIAKSGVDDVRAHPFFGNYDSVLRSIKKLHRDVQGRRASGGIVRKCYGSEVFAYDFVERCDVRIAAEAIGPERDRSLPKARL